MPLEIHTGRENFAIKSRFCFFLPFARYGLNWPCPFAPNTIYSLACFEYSSSMHALLSVIFRGNLSNFVMNIWASGKRVSRAVIRKTQKILINTRVLRMEDWEAERINNYLRARHYCEPSHVLYRWLEKFPKTNDGKVTNTSLFYKPTQHICNCSNEFTYGNYNIIKPITRISTNINVNLQKSHVVGTR